MTKRPIAEYEIPVRPARLAECGACGTFHGPLCADGRPSDTEKAKGAVTMTTYERHAHAKAARLSRKHEDEYYVLRDDCYEPCEPESYFVTSGTRRDIYGDEMGCEVIAAYAAGRRLPDYD